MWSVRISLRYSHMKSDFIQLILCVESNEKAKTDRYYINSVLKEHFNVENNKISYVYMDGKYKYKSTKVLKEIAKLKRDFSITNTGESYVIYCCDKDKNMSDPNDWQFVQDLEKYCEDNECKLIWFVKTIEDVMLKKIVCDKDKVKEAIKFTARNLISSVPKSRLSAGKNVNARHKSNIMIVFNEFSQIQKT